MTSVAFGLMHLGSHSTGNLTFDIARVVVLQGSMGFLLGVVWMRYRNLTVNIVIHIIANGWPVAVALLRLTV